MAAVVQVSWRGAVDVDGPCLELVYDRVMVDHVNEMDNDPMGPEAGSVWRACRRWITKVLVVGWHGKLDVEHLWDRARVLHKRPDLDGLAVRGRVQLHHLAADAVDEPVQRLRVPDMEMEAVEA